MRRAAAPAALWVVLGLAAATVAAAGPAVQIRATLEPAVIGVDETATLTLEAQAGGLESLRFRPLFELDNLEVVDGPAQFEDFSLINGSLSRTFRLTWHLRPRAPGAARVRALTIRLPSALARLPNQEIRVQEQPTGAPRARGGPGSQAPEDLWERFFGRAPFDAAPAPARGPAALLRAEVQPPRPVVGEQVLYTVYLYTHQDIAAINTSDVPTFRGFWARTIPQPEHLVAEPAAIDGTSYERVAVLRKALFPLRPGRQLLEPTAMDVVVEPARSLFGTPLARPEQLHLRTPELAVDVQPLPPPPPGFGGAVGRLALAAAVQPASLRLGEAATLTLTLAGAGNLQGVPAPELLLPAGLTTYPPQQQAEDRLAGTAVEGRRTWTYVVIPQRAGRYALQPQGIVFFDPARREYRLAAALPLALNALPMAPAAAGNGAPHSIRSAALHEVGPPVFRHWPPLLAWFALPWGLALVALLVRRGGWPGASAGAGSGSRAAAGGRPGDSLDRRLREAAAEPRPGQAAARIEEVWRDYLSTRWGVPPTTPAARWSAALGERGADAGAAGELAGLTEDLHFLRYAPQLSATETLRGELLSRSRLLLRRLR
ncbi:MAG TPA: BatD family protein [Thermoanaerobaculia bacterium]|nr:BatD family protein [Thermoanaerobaculia bacterium]